MKQNDTVGWWHLIHTVFQLAAFRNKIVMHWKLFYLKPNLAGWNWRALWVIWIILFLISNFRLVLN